MLGPGDPISLCSELPSSTGVVSIRTTVLLDTLYEFCYIGAKHRIVISTSSLLAFVPYPQPPVARHTPLGYYTRLSPEHTVRVLWIGQVLEDLLACSQAHRLIVVRLCRAQTVRAPSFSFLFNGAANRANFGT